MFRKQNARQPVAAVLLALLLTLTIAFSCIGLSGWVSFRQQAAALDAQYITAAFPIDREDTAFFERYNGFEGWEGFNKNSGTWETRKEYTIYPSYRNPADGTIVTTDNEKISELADTAPGILRHDTNILSPAYTPNQKGLSSGTVEPGAYQRVYDLHRYSQSVMAVRCVSLLEKILPREKYGFSDGSYKYLMEWVEPVCRMDAYDLPGLTLKFEMTFPLPIFEEGKTYLVRGDFQDFGYWQNLRVIPGKEGEAERTEGYWEREDEAYLKYQYTHLPADEKQAMTFEEYTRTLAAQMFFFFYPCLPSPYPEGFYANIDDDFAGHRRPVVPHFFLDLQEETIDLNDGSWIVQIPFIPADGWPFFAEYEGDWRDFLNTEEGRVWRDEIIPNCQRNHNSVPVLFTDNVQGLSQFCKEESALVEGRMIAPEEYKTGAAVCMVSVEYAQYNGLSVGDMLTLDLYKPAYSTEYGQWQMWANSFSFLYTGCMPLVPENRLDVTRDYTIVGLYSAPARPMDEDGHGFRGDTVLAPKASAPEVVAAAEEDTLTPLLNTLVLKNGSIDEFEAYMAENGAAERFRYYDYGYSAMAESLQAMEKNASRLALLGGAAFLLGAAVFLLAGFARMAPAARGLRLLGAGAGYVTREMLSALLPLAAAGAGVGALLGGALYGKVCEVVLSESLAVNWPILLGCAALELAVLCAAACVWAALAARRSLMRRKEE